MIGFNFKISQCNDTNLSMGELLALNFNELKGELAGVTRLYLRRLDKYEFLLGLVDDINNGHVRGVLLDGSGYPYLFLTFGRELKDGLQFCKQEDAEEQIKHLEDDEIYLVEAWDLS